MAKVEICIIGVGRFGKALIENLSSNLNYRIIAVDIDEQKLTSVDKYVDAAIIGDATKAQFFLDNGLDRIDNFIVGTATNMQSSLLIISALIDLKKTNVYAKVTDENHEKIVQALGITKVISPDSDSARQVAYELTNPLQKLSHGINDEVSSIELDGNFNWTKVKVSVNSPVINNRIMDIPDLRESKIIVALLSRNGKYTVPKGQDVILDGDVVFVIGKGKSLINFVKKLSPNVK